jgi:hypothetical protein
MPPRPPDAFHEVFELVGLEAQVLQRVVLDHRFLLQQPEHHLLAVDGGQGRDAKVDLAAMDLGGEAPVLGQPALRDVEPGDDLEPRHHREVQRARDLQEIEQEPVYAIADARAILVRLHVDVGGGVAGGAAQHVVHDLDHRRVVGLGAELLDVHRFLGGGGESHREAQVLAERLVDALGGDHPAVGALDGLLDGAAGPMRKSMSSPVARRRSSMATTLSGIGGGHDEAAPVALRRDHAMLARDLLGNELHHLEVEGGQILAGDRLLAELSAEILEQDLLVDEAHLDEDLAQPVLALPLPLERGGHLLVGEDAVLDQHLAQRHPAPALGGDAHTPVRPEPSSSSRRRTSPRPGWASVASERKVR